MNKTDKQIAIIAGVGVSAMILLFIANKFGKQVLDNLKLWAFIFATW